ncbi:hypothetical protein EBZ70_08495 [bacterium]|nr:hypothetical protein [bacterium]
MKSPKSSRGFRVSPLTASVLSAALAALTPYSLQAALVTKANNTDSLDLSTSWNGGLPGTGDTAVWDSTSTAGVTLTSGIGSGLSVSGLSFDASLNGNVSVLARHNLGSGFAFDAATDTITSVSHGLSNGQQVYITNAPAGLTSNTVGYYVVNASANTFQLSLTSGGVPIDFTANSISTTTVSGFSFNATTDVITFKNHGLTSGQPVYLGSAPTGLSNSVVYFVINATTDTFQLATTSGGTAVNFTANSTTATVRGGGGSITLSSGGINFASAPAARSATFSNYTNLSANQTWTLGGTADAVQINHNGIITGTGALTVDGSGLGILSLQSPNTFSGGLTLNAGGSIKVGGNTTVSGSTVLATGVGTGPLTINGGKIFGGSDTTSATIAINSDFTVNVGTNTNNGRLGLGGGINLGGAERKITLGRTQTTASAALTGTNASFRLTTVVATPVTGPATTVSNGTLRFAAEQSAIDNNLWVGLVFQGSASFPGNTNIIIGNRIITATGTSSHFGNSGTTSAPYLTVENGAIFNTSDGATATRSSQIAGLNGDGVITNFDTDGATSNSNISAITVGNSNASGTFTGRILNGATANSDLGLNLSTPPSVDSIVSITKTGTGTQVLSGANKYTGNTAISAGKLITTTASDQTISSGTYDTGLYTVSSGATLGVRVHQAGASLKLKGLTFNSGPSNLELDLSTFGNPTAPLINNSGALAVNGGVTLNLIGSSGGLSAGTYTLITSAGRSGAGSFTLGTLPVGVTATLVESGTNLNLVISNVNLSYQWTGATNNLWNTGGANLNWLLGGSNSGYSDATSRDVLFNDSATGSTDIDLSGLVTPKSTTFTSSTLAYSVSGTGGIGGTGSLSKSGSSSLNLATTNTYSGGTNVTDGTLNVTGALADSGAVTVNGGTATYTVGSNDTIGALTLTSGIVNGSGTLSPSSVSAVSGTISAKLGGAATITKTGTGNATLSGVNSYTGVTTVSTGTLTLGNAQSLGSTAGGTVLAANTSSTGTSLILPDGMKVTGETATIGGLGNGSRGVIRVASGSATWDGDVVIDNSSGLEARLGGSTTSTSGSNVTLTISGVISGGSSSLPAGTVAAAIRSNSAADTIVLSGANTYAGDTGLWAGILRLAGGNNRLPVTTRLVTNSFIAQPIKLDLNGTNQQIAGLLDSDAGGLTGSLTTVTNESTTASVLTIANADINEFTGTCTGNLSLVKSGVGSLTLSGTHAYTGGTTVNAGTLALAQTGLADAADIRINGGVLALNYGGTDTVHALYVNGVLQPAGVYGATGSGAAIVNDTLFSGTGTLTVTTGAVTDPYAAWAAGYNFNGGDATASGDPDHDGVSNLLEWVLGGDPTVADSAAHAVQVVKDATYLNLVFERSDSSESAVTLEARWGTDLTNWTNVTIGASSATADANGVIVTVVENGAAADNVTVSIPLARASGGRLFGTIRATKN